jgi:hypothetical protein
LWGLFFCFGAMLYTLDLPYGIKLGGGFFVSLLRITYTSFYMVLLRGFC